MSDTPRTDARQLKEGPYGNPSHFVSADFARELERELAVANNWVEHHQNHCDDLIKENAALLAELQAQAVVNGKGGEREAGLLAENTKLQAHADKVGAANDKLFMENLYLGKDKQRLDFLESLTGSLWLSLHLVERGSLTRKEIDRRMATEAKP